jgi:hypothetical protein
MTTEDSIDDALPTTVDESNNRHADESEDQNNHRDDAQPTRSTTVETTIVDPEGTLVLTLGRGNRLQKLIVSTKVKSFSHQWKALVAERYALTFASKSIADHL